MTPIEKEKLAATANELISDEASIVEHLKRGGHGADEIKGLVESGAFDELGIRDGFLRALSPFKDIIPIGIESIVESGPFDRAQKVLESGGYRIISLSENAQLRIQQGANHDISRNGNWTREGIIYIPKEKPRLVRNSPILYSAREAVKAHRNGKEFYPTNDGVEQALTDSAEFPSSNIEIPTGSFGEDALTVYAFGGEQQAKAYGEFLRQAGIKKLPVWVVDQDYVQKQNRPFARQMWFRNLGGGSILVGYGRYLRCGDRLRGVKVSAEGTSQKSGSLEESL